MAEQSVRNGIGGGVRSREMKLTAQLRAFDQDVRLTSRLGEQFGRSALAGTETGNLDCSEPDPEKLSISEPPPRRKAGARRFSRSCSHAMTGEDMDRVSAALRRLDEARPRGGLPAALAAPAWRDSGLGLAALPGRDKREPEQRHRQ